MTDGLCVRYCSSRDFQPSAAAAAYFGFGELEEALIHGGGGGASANAAGGVDPGMTIKSDAPGQQTKRKLSSSSLSLSPNLGYLPKRLVFLPRLCTAPRSRTGRDMPRLSALLLVSIPMQHTVCAVCICSSSALPMTQRWKHHV